MKLSDENNLALKAALKHSFEAGKIWNELMEKVAFDEIDDKTIRIIPAIYRNLMHEKNILEIGRLKGAYQHAWLTNSGNLSSLLGVLKDFENHNINYRIMKGLGVVLILKSFGFRNMGDIDVVISNSDFHKARNCLERNGFAEIYQSSCSHRISQYTVLDTTWRNNKGVEIDLHVPSGINSHANRNFFETLLASKPRTINLSSVNIKIPQPELMFIQAVLHGEKKIAETDQIQTFIDCGVLASFTERKKLLEFSKQFNATQTVSNYIAKLNSVIGEDVKFTNELNQDNSEKLLSYVGKVHGFDKLSRLTKIFKQRKLTLYEAANLFFNRDNLKFSYKVWILFLQIRPFERLRCKKAQGFFRRNAITDRIKLEGRSWIQPNPSQIAFSSLYKYSQDYRFSIRPQEDESNKIRIRIQAQALKLNSFLIFSNGELLTTTRPNADGIAIFSTNADSRLEISIRSTLKVCGSCLPDFSDFIINISS